jgi:hypothetical protein
MPLPIYRFSSSSNAISMSRYFHSPLRCKSYEEYASDMLLEYVQPIDIMYVVVGETNGQGLVIYPHEWPVDNIVRDSHIELWTLNQKERGLHPHQYFESSRYRLVQSKVLKDSDILPDLLTQPDE